MSKQRNEVVLAGRIESYILMIRGQRVMLDADLAELYRTTTKGADPGGQTESRAVPRRFSFSFDQGRKAGGGHKL